MEEFEKERKAEQEELDYYLETELFKDDSSYISDNYDYYDLSSFYDDERYSFCEDETEDETEDEAGDKPEAEDKAEAKDDEPQEIVQGKSQVEPQAEPKSDVGIKAEAF